jgi:D-alanyl-D-alanine carboxypeptidase
VATLAVSAGPAQAHHWRHYHYYARHQAYVRHQAAPAFNPAFAALVIDANSGRTLYSVAENELRHPASLTKVMTLYLLFEQLDKGRLTLESPITMSAHAASQAPSKLGLPPGESLSVEEAIKAVVTRSANDVAVAIAENIGGDEESFAEMMTRKAHALGMSRTTYVNASGLPDDRQITTAHDLGVLGRAVEERFPRYFHYFSTHSFDFAGETIGNHNHLLGRVDGVDGIKTGYTRASGFNLLTSMHRDGRSLVAVVMGGPTAGARDRLMESLLAQHLASASTAHTATMIADASSVEPMRVAAAETDRRYAGAPMPLSADPPAPPARGQAIVPVAYEAPTPPARMAAQLSEEDAEAQGDSIERDPPAPTLEATRRVVKHDNRIAPTPAAAPARVADANPVAAGWVKGPEGVAQPTEGKAAAETRQNAEPKAAQAPAKVAAAPVRAEKGPAALGWVKGPEGVTASAEQKAAPAKPIVAAVHPKEETAIARNEVPRPAHEGWVIQIGATDNAGKANDLLIRAKAQNRSTLASAKPFTEKIEKGDGVFYRARFAGLDSASAESACRTLKRSGFSCFTTHD